MAYPNIKDYPKKIKIGNKSIKVNFRKKLIDNSMGLYVFNESHKEIKIKQSQEKAQIFETFIHEAIHAIEDVYGIKIPHKIINRIDGPLALILSNSFDIKKRKNVKKKDK